VKLLLVDDDERVRELLRTTFELADVEVSEAGDTRAAARAIADHPPDAIVLDVAMPGESGLALCRRLKDDPATAGIPVVLLTGSLIGEEAARAGADAFLTKPFSPLELLGLIERLPAAGRARASRAGDRVDDQLLLYADDMRRLLERERAQRKALERAYVETVETLTTALESRDTDTGEHAQRVRLYAVVLTDEVDPSLLDSAIEYGFLLHDVGKIGVPDRVLLKPGPLDPDERRLMQKHTLVGERMLQHVAWLAGAPLAVVRSHHERWDGRGYPDGLRGEEIPVEARIFALADALDAVSSERPYRRATAFDTAVESLIEDSGSHFDPAAVDALRSRREELHDIYREHGNGSAQHSE
jgi:response regulator RpfG family c-di-GMP phosphodiesterase